MQTEKTYQYRIYPNKKQKDFFTQTMGCCRFVFNHYLSLNKKNHENNQKYMGYNDTAHDLVSLKQKYIWLKDVSAQTLQNSLKDLDFAFKGLFSKRTGYPEFKRKFYDKSFRVSGDFRYNPETKELFIPKLMKDPIKVHMSKKEQRRLQNKEINYITVTLSKTGKYHVCFSVTVEQELLPVADNMIGIDLGVISLITDSDGYKVSNPKHLKRFENKLKYRHRQLSKKKHKSSNRRKARKELAKTYERLVNIRKDFLHKETMKIISENQVIICEDLKVADMIENGKSSNHRKSIQNACMGEILRQLKYKSKWYGRTFYQVDTYFASSKICYNCEEKNELLTENEREWTCSYCGKKHDRDINAAKNIKRQGLKDLGLWNAILQQKPVEASGLPESAKQDAADFSRQ